MKSQRCLTIFAWLLMLSLSCVAQAAAEQQNGDQLQERLQKLKERLELTPEQTERIRPVLLEEMQQLKAVRGKYSGDKSSYSKMAEEIRGIQSSTDEKLKTILSEKQMEEWKKIREESREQAGEERLRRIEERLELTPEQTDRIRPVLMEEMQQLKAVRGKYSGEQSRRSQRKMAGELRDVLSSTDEKLKKILSERQMDEWKKIREESREQLKKGRDR